MQTIHSNPHNVYPHLYIINFELIIILFITLPNKNE